MLAQREWLFRSFFIGGFECSTHLNAEGQRLDLIAATQHDAQAATDYALCCSIGLRAVREAARWPILDRGGVLDLESVRALAALARSAGLIQIWDLMHYGYPDDLDPLVDSGAFVDRFAAYARAVACVVRAETRGPTYYTPVNEISYHAWAGGEVGYMAPFGVGRGPEYKRVLVRAAIAAMNAVWAVDPLARVVTAEPLVRIHPPTSRQDLRSAADHFNQRVVPEAFDLLAGRLEPELGGSRAHLGIVGLNYYACNQWTIPTPDLPQRFLEPGDPDWIPLSDLLRELHDRYGGPLILAETGSSAEDRPAWLDHLRVEVTRALDCGVDLQAACLYPVVTSPDWEDPTAFFDGGVFDIVPRPDGQLARVLSRPVAAALRAVQTELDPRNLPFTPLEVEADDAPASPIRVLRPLESPTFRADNFAYQTLATGESLVVERYCFEPGASVTSHRHADAEHVITVLAGEGMVRIAGQRAAVRRGESVVVPRGVYHAIHNDTPERLIVQQVSGPRPWDARFQGPHPPSARHR